MVGSDPHHGCSNSVLEAAILQEGASTLQVMPEEPRLPDFPSNPQQPQSRHTKATTAATAPKHCEVALSDQAVA
jgi:hypothetical protein